MFKSNLGYINLSFSNQSIDSVHLSGQYFCSLVSMSKSFFFWLKSTCKLDMHHYGISFSSFFFAVREGKMASLCQSSSRQLNNRVHFRSKTHAVHNLMSMKDAFHSFLSLFFHLSLRLALFFFLFLNLYLFFLSFFLSL